MDSLLYGKLKKYGQSDYYGFHMPGHKRNIEIAEMDNPFLIDITEIDGFDNLHNPHGIIEKEMKRAKEIYQSKRTFFLVNGSTCGNLSAISAAVKHGDKIIIGRNVHKSVYNAIELFGLKVSYLYPNMVEHTDIFGDYSLERTQKIIEENQDAKAIVITSPTYEGIVSDIRGICNIAHKYGIPLIVDSAHGAHFILSDRFPKSALSCGADIVIESLHKTMPSLTQTAMLHFNSDIIPIDKIKKYLSVYQTSSPSYVLMSSITNCVDFVVNDGKKSAEKFLDRMMLFRDNMKNLKHIMIPDHDFLGGFDFDISKIIIMVRKNRITGKELKDILNRDYHLEMEMAAGNYVLAMASVMDTEEGFQRLEKALIEIDYSLSQKPERKAQTNEFHNGTCNIYSIRNKKRCEICEAAMYMEDESDGKIIRDGKGCISTNYIYLYPPGIPVVVPGEEINDELENMLNEYQKAGYEIVID